MRVHCKKCDGKSFNSVRSLRIHQWRDHRESYGNVGYRKELIVRPAEQLPEMSARALLQKLKNQATFIHDVVTLVEGLIK